MDAPASLAELAELSPGLRPGRDGRLEFGGCALADLAEEFGTAAILVDAATLRSTAERYVEATTAVRPNSRVHFATKAFPVPAVVQLMAEAGLYCDVASAGELAIALAGGMPAGRMLLHGNAKRDLDIDAALRAEIGLIVIDSFDDMDRIERLAQRPQPVIVRINPGVLAPTHEAMATGHGDSKFGIPNGQVEAAIARAAASPKMEMLGLHVHIGSQILELDPFVESVERIAALGTFDLYDLGGGLGSRYAMDEPEAPSIESYAKALLGAAAAHLPDESVVAIEPGRSTVAPAGVTLYSVVGVKRGERTFVAIDGGMGDNMETALYGTRFWPAIVDKEGDPELCDVVGHHCETGDRLATDAWLSAPEVGDLLVIPVTGAYCHSMANNYNAMPRPPVIFVEDGDARVAMRRETIADLLERAIRAMDQREIAALLAELVACDSTNPELAPGGAGEAAHAALVAKWMERIGFQVEVTDAAPGRPNVLATLPGTGNGRNLLICGHGDVVAAAPEAFQPRIDGDRMRGRGAIDMKGGLVAGMAAAAGIAAGDPLAGDLILAVVADEEFRSAGAEALAADLEADGAILPEQTALDLVTEHGGFAWFEITAQGVEAAGDDPEGGVDAIAHLGRTLDGLLALDRELAERPAAPYGRPCLHAGTLSGGSQLSAYPAEARVGIERCTVPGETWQQARRELEALIEGVAPDDPRATLALNTLLGRDPIRLDPDEPVVEVLAESAASILGRAPTLRGDMGWMDSGVLTPAGIPCVAFGPIGGGEHTPDEWVDLPSIATCAAVLEEAARRFCS